MTTDDSSQQRLAVQHLHAPRPAADARSRRRATRRSRRRRTRPTGGWFYYVTVNLRTGETKFATTYDEFLQLQAGARSSTARRPDALLSGATPGRAVAPLRGPRRPDRALAVAGAAPGGVRRAGPGLDLRRRAGGRGRAGGLPRGLVRRRVARAVADHAAQARAALPLLDLADRAGAAGRCREHAAARRTARRARPTTPTCPARSPPLRERVRRRPSRPGRRARRRCDRRLRVLLAPGRARLRRAVALLVRDPGARGGRRRRRCGATRPAAEVEVGSLDDLAPWRVRRRGLDGARRRPRTPGCWRRCARRPGGLRRGLRPVADAAGRGGRRPRGRLLVGGLDLLRAPGGRCRSRSMTGRLDVAGSPRCARPASGPCAARWPSGDPRCLGAAARLRRGGARPAAGWLAGAGSASSSWSRPGDSPAAAGPSPSVTPSLTPRSPAARARRSRARGARRRRLAGAGLVGARAGLDLGAARSGRWCSGPGRPGRGRWPWSTGAPGCCPTGRGRCRRTRAGRRALVAARAAVDRRPARRWCARALGLARWRAWSSGVLWWIYPRGLGFGDVRLAALLGVGAGLARLGRSSLVGIYAGLPGFGGVLRRAAGRCATARCCARAYPFGPFMLLGALLGLVGEPAAGRVSSGRLAPECRRAVADGRLTAMLRWLTAGESHGPALVAILEGLPAHVRVTTDDIARRPGPPAPRLRPRRADEVRAGRGRRSSAASGTARRMGGPVAIEIGNTEWPKWEQVMSADPVDPVELEALARNAAADPAAPGPRRPGRHAEVRLRRGPPGPRARLGPRDRGPGRARPRWPRTSSSRRPAPGSSPTSSSSAACARPAGLGARARTTSRGSTTTRCAASTPTPARRWSAEIDQAHKDGDTLGGVVEVVVHGLPPGLGLARALGPAARRPAGRRADGHPGDQGRRGRRRLRARRHARLAGARRDRADRRRRIRRTSADAPAAPRAA